MAVFELDRNKKGKSMRIKEEGQIVKPFFFFIEGQGGWVLETKILLLRKDYLCNI